MTQATTTTPTTINTKENTMENSNTKDSNTKDTITNIDQIDDTEIADRDETSPTDSVDQPASARSKKAKKVAKPLKATGPNVRILKVNRCSSLSGRSELTYHIGCIGNAIQIRVYQNTGKGYFNQEWIAYSAIQEVLTSHEEFSAGTLRSIFIGKSVNTAGFFLAVLKNLGLIETSKTNQRLYSHCDSVSFEDQTAQLIASDVSIEIAEPQKVKTAKSADIAASGPGATTANPSIATAPSSKKGTLKVKKA